MKTSITYGLLLISLMSLRFTTDSFFIQKDFNDAQIAEVEQNVLTEFKVKIKIEVFKRNTDNTILHLICQRFDMSGKLKGSCESDNFGKLEIMKDGCSISDKEAK